jgi:predicted permease
MISESVVRDLSHGLRLLARSPASTLLAVVALAAGIGINTAVYTGYKAMVARPLDAHDPSTMVNLALKRGPGSAQWSFSYPDYEMLRDSMHSLSGLVAYRPAQLTISARALGHGATPSIPAGGTMLGRLALLQNNSTGSAEFASVFVVSANYFRVLGVGLVRGRDFESYRHEEFLKNPVVLISENYWQKRFGGAPAVVGRTVFLNSVGVVIAGITPHDFCGTSVGAPAFWAPVDIEPLLHADEQFLRDREAQRYRLFGRLAPHASVAQAQAELSAALDGLRALHDPRSDAAKPATALVWRGSPFPLPLGEYRGLTLSIALIMAAAGLVLMVACANVASLQLARMRARDDELRIRLSLGANRLRIVRQLVTESAVVGLMSGGLALLFTWVLLKQTAVAAANLIPGEYGGLVFDVAPDLAIFAYVCAVSLIAGMISGLAPAMESSRAALKPASSGSTATAGTRRLQDILIAAQVTLSLVLMVAAAMAIRSSIRAVAIDTGYETRQVLALHVEFPDSLKYTAGRKRTLVDELRARLARLPGVVAMTNARLPADIESRTAAATLERADSSRLGRQAILHYTYVQPNYFETLGIPLMLGSGFTARAERTVVVSESTARELWGSQNPIGRSVRLGATDELPRRANELVADGLSYQVVGVARDTRTTDFSATVSKRIYLQLPDDRAATYPILVRIRNTPAADTIRLIEPLLTAVDPNLVANCATLENLLQQTAAFIVAMLAALVSSAVGLLGLVLAIMGIYGTVSYIVVLRTREVGIRMAIGAQVGDVLWAILRECGRPLVAGLALGSLLAAGLAHFARGLLFGLDGIDVESQALVALTLLAIGLIASYPPALRATRVDPLVALRHQ